MTVFGNNGYLVPDIATLLAIGASDRPAFKVATLVAGVGWYEYDNTATTGGLTPADSPATGRWFPVAKELLRANRTYYVRTDGNDSNNGLANTSGGAFLTIPKAINVAATLDLNGFNLKIKVGNGTYTSAITLKEITGYSAAGCLIIEGDTATPSNVILSVTSDNCILAKNINSTWDIQGFKFQTTTSGSALRAENSSLRYGSVDFGACAIAHIVQDTAARIECIANYAITGSAIYHWYVSTNSALLCALRTITLSGTPNFSFSFIRTVLGGVANIPLNTFSGSATGKRYDAAGNSVIETDSGGASYLPGNVDGSFVSGGQYI